MAKRKAKNKDREYRKPSSDLQQNDYTIRDVEEISSRLKKADSLHKMAGTLYRITELFSGKVPTPVLKEYYKRLEVLLAKEIRTVEERDALPKICGCLARLSSKTRDSTVDRKPVFAKLQKYIGRVGIQSFEIP